MSNYFDHLLLLLLVGHIAVLYVRRYGLLLQTEERGLSVGLSPAKMPFGLWTQIGPRNHYYMGPRSPMRRGNFDGVGRPTPLRRAVQKTAEPIEMSFGFVDSDWLKEARIWWSAHWRHLTNTNEPSMCGGDAALRQITLTTCCYYFRR